MLASGSHDSTIKLWDVKTSRERMTLRGHAGRVYSVAFSPDGRLLASSSSDGTVRLWDPEKKFDDELKTFQLSPPHGTIHQVTFTPDGRHLVTANANRTVYVLRLREWLAE